MHRLIFEQHVLAAKDKMFRFAFRMLGNVEDAHDVVQDAFVKIWKQKEKLVEINNSEAWCMQVTKNLCLDRFKTLKVRKEAVKELQLIRTENTATPYQEAVQKDQVKKVQETIDSLPEKFRMIIHLREVEGYSYKEISEILDLSINEVKINLFRARKLLRDRFVKNKLYELP